MPDDSPARRPWRRPRRAIVATGVVSVAVLLGASLLSACDDSGSPSSAGGSLTVYVKPGGHGSGDGTRSSPYTSLAAARDALRPRLASMRTDATVQLASGTYTLSRPFMLTAADSGRNGHKVIYTAQAGAHPVLSGGVAVGGWRVHDAAKGIWVASVPSSLRTRQLYVDGRRAQVAQGPLPVALTQTRDGYTAGSSAMAGWTDPSGIELVYVSGPSNWTETRCRVATISGTTITMAQPCWDNSTLRLTPGTALNTSGFGQALGKPSFVANAYELLTQPGQWYLDDAKHLLYYEPLPGQDMRRVKVVAPRIQTLVQGAGGADAPIHEVAFRGITFSYATWMGPSSPDGYSSFQAGELLTGRDAYRLQGACDSPEATCPYASLTQVPGNVAFRYDRNLEFSDDTFEHLGAAGLALGDGSQDGLVRGNVFTDTSGSGLSIGAVDQPLAQGGELTSGMQVVDNWFHGTSAEYQDAAALFVGYAQYTTIRNNQIDDVPYSGISIGWGGWLERFPYLGPLSNSSRGNVIRDNLIFDVMKVIVDGGGIYTNGIEGTSTANGEVIEGNVVLQQHHLSWAIYTDNGTQFVTVRNNVVWDALNVPLAPFVIPGASPAFSFGGCGGGPIAYDGNYSIQADPAGGLISANAACGGHPLEGVTVTDNRVIASLDQVPAALLGGAGLEPPYRTKLTPTPMPTGLPASTTYP
jgi:hypothetical protein